MNTEKYAQAQRTYDSGDYSGALSEFLSYAKADPSTFEPGDQGYLYHMMGNCLVKMKRYDKAASTYERALADEEYPRHAALNVNLGVAYSSLKQYDRALDCFQAALDDPTYSTPYKAYTAMGNALLKLKRPADAGVMYRKAALEENNPDPARSLVNLGVCFMALSRPHDAVESYVTALEFDTTADARNKTYANLGQAYVATGRMPEAVDAFEHALSDGTYHLSDSALTDYDRAKANVNLEANPSAGLDTFDKTVVIDAVPRQDSGVIPPPDDTGFFTLTEEEIDQRGRYEEKAERKMRNTGLKVFLVIAIILLLVVGAAAFAYYKGYGWPLQETVISEMFQAHSEGKSVSEYWASVDEADLTNTMNGVGTSDNISIDSIERTMNESTAYVTQTLDEGGQIRYRITMGRDGLTWKITNIEMDWASYPLDD